MVITIIVLLILAGVSIATLTGQNGILTQASNASKQTKEADAKEQVQLAIAGSYGENGKIDLEKLKDNLNKIEGISEVPNPIEKLPLTVAIKGVDVTIDGTYKVTVGETLGVTAGIRVEEMTKDNYSDGTKRATIPVGFAVSGISGEKIVDEGLVIYELPEGTTLTSEQWNVDSNSDGIPDVQTMYNQYVWIPVTKYSDFHLIEGYYNKLLQSHMKDSPPSREAGSSLTEILPGLPNTNNTVKGTEESVAMYKSVKDYEGFYIARYEAGVEGIVDNDSLSIKTVADGTVKPLSKRGVGVWNSINFGGSSSTTGTDGLPGNDTVDGAVRISRKLYEENNNINSTLCYGVQWDAVMNFMDSSYIRGECNAETSYVANSTGKGNYKKNDETSVIATTGSNNNYAVKNIFDMAGNVYEWTMEAYGANGRGFRGGYYGNMGSSYPASYRGNYLPEFTFSTFGFRLALYL